MRAKPVTAGAAAAHAPRRTRSSEGSWGRALLDAHVHNSKLRGASHSKPTHELQGIVDSPFHRMSVASTKVVLYGPTRVTFRLKEVMRVRRRAAGVGFSWQRQNTKEHAESCPWICTDSFQKDALQVIRKVGTAGFFLYLLMYILPFI